MKRYLITILLCVPLLCTAQSLEEQLVADAAVLLDFHTGEILFNKNGELPIPPASMTKVVTLYMAYQYLQDTGLDPNTEIVIDHKGSAFSRPSGSSLMGLEEGQRVTFHELMAGLAVASGNDAAYALASYISGDAELFVQAMNRQTHELGYEDFTFVDPDGWSENNWITASGYARFCREYIERFPQALEELHSVPYLNHPRPEQIPPGARIVTPRTKKNTNLLLGKVQGVDGLKTGYIPESGFNFTATAKRGYTRLIAVIMGVHTSNFRAGLINRARQAEILLEYGYEHFLTAFLRAESNSITMPLWRSESSEIGLTPLSDFDSTLKVSDWQELIVVYETPEPLTAPLDQGEDVGLCFLYGPDLQWESRLVTSREAATGSFTKSVKDSIRLLLRRLRR